MFITRQTEAPQRLRESLTSQTKVMCRCTTPARMPRQRCRDKPALKRNPRGL